METANVNLFFVFLIPISKLSPTPSHQIKRNLKPEQQDFTVCSQWTRRELLFLPTISTISAPHTRWRLPVLNPACVYCMTGLFTHWFQRQSVVMQRVGGLQVQLSRKWDTGINTRDISLLCLSLNIQNSDTRYWVERERERLRFALQGLNAPLPSSGELHFNWRAVVKQTDSIFVSKAVLDKCYICNIYLHEYLCEEFKSSHTIFNRTSCMFSSSVSGALNNFQLLLVSNNCMYASSSVS